MVSSTRWLPVWVALGLGCGGEAPGSPGTFTVSRSPASPVYANHPTDPESSFLGDPSMATKDGVHHLIIPSFIHVPGLRSAIPDAVPWGPCDGTWGAGKCSIPLGLATSTDGLAWTRFDRGTPDDLTDDWVLTPGPAGDWDAGNLEAPTVLVDPRDGLFKVWYNGLVDDSDETVRLATQKIGFAWSADGITWQKYDDPATTEAPYAASDPILQPRPGKFDALATPDPCVLFDDGGFKLWYGGISETEVAVGYAESEDGITWVRRAEPVLEHDGFATGADVIRAGEGFHMFYYAKERGIWYATSPDGILWEKRGKALSLGPAGAWDELETSAPLIRLVGSQYYLYYTGSSCPIDGTGPAGCSPHIKLGAAMAVLQ